MAWLKEISILSIRFGAVVCVRRASMSVMPLSISTHTYISPSPGALSRLVPLHTDGRLHRAHSIFAFFARLTKINFDFSFALADFTSSNDQRLGSHPISVTLRCGILASGCNARAVNVNLLACTYASYCGVDDSQST